jgi:sarcosine oxidase subunit gamma
MADRRSPLAGLLPWALPNGAVALAEAPGLLQIGLRLKPQSDAVSGVRLPLAPNRVEATRAVRSLWLGPDEWLITASQAAAPWLHSALTRALVARHAAVVDLSSSRVAIEIAGSRARALLEKGCSLDLHPRAFGPGQCAQTLLAKTQIVLDQLDATPLYRVFVRASYARWLCDWLVDAAAEFAAPNMPDMRIAQADPR